MMAEEPKIEPRLEAGIPMCVANHECESWRSADGGCRAGISDILIPCEPAVKQMAKRIAELEAVLPKWTTELTVAEALLFGTHDSRKGRRIVRKIEREIRQAAGATT